MARRVNVNDETLLQCWQRYRRAIAGEPLPLAIVDLDAFDRNLDRILAVIRAGKKRMRIATKSVRCPTLIERVLERGKDAAAGVMTYTASETAFLAERGQRDLLLAYPTLGDADMSALVRAQRTGATAAVTVDAIEQLEALDRAAAAAGLQLPFVVEVDLAYRPWGLYLGVRRSPLRSVEDVTAFVAGAARFAHLRFHGLMGYEAQIAGLTDHSRFSRWSNPPKRLIKVRSRPKVEATRRALLEALRSLQLAPALFNGGGTGSLSWSASDPALTEVTVGSGFLASHLFDAYRDLSLEPAAFFALQVTRRPAPGVVTCHGGGFVASGQSGPDRLPIPALPPGLELLPLEGAGEVQTPVRGPAGTELALGDPVFFRHAKAGELAEHVNEYLLIRGDRIESRAPTYRGLGHCFLG